jgi:hypothetical protein
MLKTLADGETHNPFQINKPVSPSFGTSNASKTQSGPIGT